MFCLRDILSQIPTDGATKWIRVENVISPMPASDVVKNFPDAISWRYICHKKRTDYVLTFQSECFARMAMKKANGLTHLGEKLKLTFMKDEEDFVAAPLCRLTSAYPQLHFVPPEFSYQARRTEADRLVASLVVQQPTNQSWVDIY
ncbi:hypothetical protein TRVL_05381 [Trypanosoma vivax]|uniref:RRM domain-containing protein n=1 Tax=Trypanosoma vivax (strain Y486) TaxID=1055687 RepID=G0U0D7_TRYVY|nr:hypothetical protein TRVL_05381 [Trypanosoma vivax]CCC49535.1 hypothetical protein TVY486_0801440 [Trypanosoma vivax Y486]